MPTAPTLAPPRRPATQLTGRARRLPPELRLPVTVFAGTELVLLLWWAACYPALTSYDSAAYVTTAVSAVWSSDHSVAYDALVWLALRTPGRIAALTLAQTVATAGALAYTCVALRGLGVRGRRSGTVAVLLAIAPPTGAFVVFLWKDVPFTLCALLVFAASARLLARTAARADWLVLAAALTGLGLFRNNGLGVALVAGLALTLGLAGRRAVLALLTAAAVGFSLLCQLVLYPAAGIVPPRVSSVHSLHYHDIAVAYAAQPTVLTAADLALLAQVAPVGEWARAGANCWVSDQLFTSAFDRAAADRLNARLIDIWQRLLTERPDLVAGARICRGHIAWAPFPGPVAQQAFTWVGRPGPTPADLYGLAAPGTPLAEHPARFALYSRPRSQLLQAGARFWYHLARTPQLDWLLFRGATWCYLGYAAVLLFARGRRMRSAHLLAGVLIGFQLTVLAANPAPLYRYMVGPLFVAPFCLTLLTARRSLTRRQSAPKA
ncbi:hypothetical protein F4556_004341 [Kitasatospora gansuensis]|uniref:Glycosyltransferase RgtA/B/C/D-like domain-containing protein n=1 Tax=Kitasatospora gansuensis TaxID=258050 RepID=A0A7W7SGD7_9ACTN|nr:hypothetical protein [Kitasatospora gansuensis]MBB4948806.1 hypothetical protein [Kitasatospora gansuensis]